MPGRGWRPFASRRGSFDQVPRANLRRTERGRTNGGLLARAGAALGNLHRAVRRPLKPSTTSKALPGGRDAYRARGKALERPQAAIGGGRCSALRFEPSSRRKIWECLGLIDSILVPHYESAHPKSSAAARNVSRIQESARRLVALKDDEVLVKEKGHTRRLSVP